ncbi:FGGY-family carbohydrate kinase [Gulosibacter molinativorax]|uniref:FGGY-family carbohydrate kinase n=1 Tax=Gulosibacter molinativorax TaxID=256821 RepID=UPI000429864D|nr:FGGY family carbohydrate kinase [Gulosibacter molinativorax]
MSPTITIDVGTTSVKVCQFDADSHLVATAKYATPTVQDEYGEVYDLEALWDGIAAFIRRLDGPARSSVRRIAITGVGESGGLVRSDLSLASPMILWHDQRGTRYLDRLTDDQRSRLYRITGLPMSGNYGLSKIAWAAEHTSDLGDAQWLNIAEHLAATMTGERWSEPSLASRTMALDLTTGAWSDEATSLVGLDTTVLPEIRSAPAGAVVTDAFAAATGLDGAVRVHVAGHDHMVGSVGAGLERGELLNSTGTTEGLLFRTLEPRLDSVAKRSKLASGLDCAGSGYTLFASIPTGGSAFATLQRMLGLKAGKLAAIVRSLHEEYVAGALDLEGVPLVLPQFRGSPPPAKRSSARGVIAGIGSDTTLEQIVFGTFLGMAVQFQDVLELFHTPPSRVKVIGPASGNYLWLQLKADVLGMPLTASTFPEVVSRGAQALASGTGWLWESNDPHDIDPHDVRHDGLADWLGKRRLQRHRLKGLSE